MFRLFRRRRRFGSGVGGIALLIILGLIFSGGIGGIFAALGSNKNTGSYTKTPESSSSAPVSDTTPTTTTTEAYPPPDDDSDNVSSIDPTGSSNAPTEPEVIVPTAENSLTVAHKDNVTFSGSCAKGKVYYKYTAPVSGVFRIRFKEVYKGDDFDLTMTDKYGNKLVFFSSLSYTGGAANTNPLEKNTTYTICVEDYYGNNKHNTFSIEIVIPDEEIVIQPKTLFVFDDFRYEAQVLEFKLTPSESATYACTIEEYDDWINVEEFGFYDSFGHKAGSHGYSVKNIATAELKAGETYSLKIENGGNDKKSGRIYFSVMKVESEGDD